MKLKTGDYVYQTEYSHDRQLHRWFTARRRRVLAVTDDRVAVSGVELLTFRVDAPEWPSNWVPAGSIQGRDATLPIDRLRDYSTRLALPSRPTSCTCSTSEEQHP